MYATMHAQNANTGLTHLLLRPTTGSRKIIMQAIEMFAAFIRTADALERIASALEAMSVEDQGFTGMPQPASPEPAGAAETKTRKRRTKAEIEADEAAKRLPSLNPVPPAPVITAAPPATGFSTASMAPPAPVMEPPVAVAATFQNIAPVPQPIPPVVSAPVAASTAGYAALSPEQQFTTLLEAFAPHSNVPFVRDALVAEANNQGLGLPFSHPQDRTLPGPAYMQVTNAARCAIYSALTAAIGRSAQASGI